MRILVLDNEFPPLGGGTGVINYFFFKELEAYPDICVDLITSSRSHRTYETERFSGRIMIYKVPVGNQNIHHARNIELMRYLWRGWGMARRLLKANHYDVSFAFSGVPAGIISYLLKRHSGLPYVLSLQGPDVPGFESRYRYIYPFLKLVLPTVWQQAAEVVTNSKMHQELAKRTESRLAFPIIYNGVDTDLFYPSSEARNGPIVILSVGRLIERKGQHHLLHAFAQLCMQFPSTPLKLQIVGTGDAEESLRALARQLNIGDKIDFAGFVSREQMPEVYRNADIFTLPSENEAMSVALLEALASGLPVVVSSTGGSDELVSAGENGYVVQWANVKDLCTALAALIQDATLRSSMSLRSRQVALAHSWREMTRQYLELIRFARLAAEPQSITVK